MSASDRPRCPFCRSGQGELVSPFGGQLITSQFRCRACHTYFEAIRGDFEPATPSEPARPSEPAGPPESAGASEPARPSESARELNPHG